MVVLTRSVRFALNPSTREPGDRGPNGYSGNPPMGGLGAHYEIVVNCRGKVAEVPGYLINIKEIDRIVRSETLPHIQLALNEKAGNLQPGELLPELVQSLAQPLRGLFMS